MTGEMLEPPVPESSVAVAGIAVGAGSDAPSGHTGKGNRAGHGGVAILLTAAAMVAAVIGFRAAVLSSQASDAWQSALRTEVKRSAVAIEDVRFLYQAELPVAMRIVQARILQVEFEAAAKRETGAVKQALLTEAAVQGQIIDSISPSSDLAVKSEYALTSGGLDLGRRLADLRAKSPATLALDPDGMVVSGDRLAAKAGLLTMALLPTSLAAFIGVLAQPFLRRRTLFLQLGSIALAAGASMAIGIELIA
jgi:hypothetical protein